MWIHWFLAQRPVADATGAREWLLKGQFLSAESLAYWTRKVGRDGY